MQVLSGRVSSNPEMESPVEAPIIPLLQICVVESDYRLIHLCPICQTITRPAPTFLTTTELEVLREIGNGGSVRGISEKRHVSRKTIEAHVQRICMKLDIPSSLVNPTRQTMVELARYAIKIGLSAL